MATLPHYHASLLDMLDRQPGKGRGHPWLFRVALHLRHYHTEDACFRLLRSCADEWRDRTVPDAEIWKAVRKAYSATAEEALAVSAVPWPEPSPEAIARVLSTTTPLFGLEPVEDLSAPRLLPALFDWDELVCAGYAQWQGATATLQEIQPNAGAFQFVVPSPMTARTGVSQEGEPAFRCLANTGPRRFLVIEGDSATKEEQARILSHLAGLLPLVLVVDSGGKSLHGWYWAAGRPEPDLRLFMEYAVHLGADPHTFVRCQWVRMPGGTRYSDGAPRPQPVIHAHADLLAEVSS
jgi:hypothetical protein